MGCGGHFKLGCFPIRVLNWVSRLVLLSVRSSLEGNKAGQVFQESLGLASINLAGSSAVPGLVLIGQTWLTLSLRTWGVPLAHDHSQGDMEQSRE